MVTQPRTVARPIRAGTHAELQAASGLGRAEAERFDEQLRRLEREERDRARESAGPRKDWGLVKASASQLATWDRLRREEAELQSFAGAIAGSRAWRTARLLHSLAGRSPISTPDAAEIATPATAPRDEQPPDEQTPDEATILALESRVAELATFVAAVTSSRAWRVIQALRRLAGRAW